MKIESIYYKSPFWVQHGLISSYGLKLYFQRYCGKAKFYERELMETEWLPQNDIEELQNRLLRKIISHAFATVPYYQQLQKNTGLNPSSINLISDLSVLPIIEKRELREAPEQFCSTKFLHRRDSFWLNTSGSTGTPLKILCDNDSRRHHYAFWTRLRKGHNLPRLSRRATFFGRIICSPEQTIPPFWRHDVFGRNLIFSSYHMSEKNLFHYCKELRSYRPDEIIGYPSSLYYLSRFINRFGIQGISPKLVITTAESLLSHQKQEISKAFKDSVLVDQYGCTEMTHFVAQCEEGTYHIHPEHGIVEVDTDGGVICTGLVNFAMPLMRYKVGDLVVLGPTGCKCGRNFPVMAEIKGRTDDIIMTADGRPLGRMDPIFKGVTGILESQIVQTDHKTIVFNVVVDSNFNEKVKNDLLTEIKKRTGVDMSIQIRTVNSIPREKNGKFRSVVSHVK